MTTTTVATTVCRHCHRTITLIGDRWFDPAATGDDAMWAETCDQHDTRTAEHEETPQPSALEIDATIRALEAERASIIGWREIARSDDAGDVGGDDQVGPAHALTLAYGPVDGRYLLLTTYAYAIEREPVDPTDARYAWQDYTEARIVTSLDPAHADELDIRYDPGQDSYRGFDTIDAADIDAQQHVARGGTWTVEHYDPTSELRDGSLAG